MKDLLLIESCAVFSLRLVPLYLYPAFIYVRERSIQWVYCVLKFSLFSAALISVNVASVPDQIVFFVFCALAAYFAFSVGVKRPELKFKNSYSAAWMVFCVSVSVLGLVPAALSMKIFS